MPEDPERRGIDIEWRRAMRDSLVDVQARLTTHIDHEEAKLGQILDCVNKMRQDMPTEHLSEHDAMREWIEERAWFKEIRRDAMKHGLLWALGILALWAAAQLFPSLKDFLPR